MIIAWDFDGVLNRNQSGGRYVWEDAFEAAVGQPASAFGKFVFGVGPGDVITGKIDILDRLQEWVRAADCNLDAQQILNLWLGMDANPDAEMLGLVDTLRGAGARQFIATNNEARRAAYIENQMGMGAVMERIFASGPMGIAKPDPGYFAHIAEVLDVPASEILFVDDLAANVQAAIDAGWQGFHFTDQTRGELIERLRAGVQA